MSIVAAEACSKAPKGSLPSLAGSTLNLTLRGPLLHIVYSILTHLCLLLDDHDARDLAALGFSEEAIKRSNYKSSPRPTYFRNAGGRTEEREITKCVVEHELNSPLLAGPILYSGAEFCVAGFYFDGCLMRLNLPPGRIVAEVRDARSSVVALQLYRGAQDVDPRWFESPGLPRGARALRRPHFARPNLARLCGGVVITEHTLAADLHAWRDGEPATAINGLLPEVFAEQLRWSFPDVENVAFAFPSPDVELLRAIEKRGFKVYGSRFREVA